MTPQPRITTALWGTLVALMIALVTLSGCTATPITLPFNDAGATFDASAADGPTGYTDGGNIPDLFPSINDAAMDATAPDAGPGDGACLECPLGDGMLDAGASDAEAGPAAEAGPPADALLGDLAVGE